jgi:thiamine pyrophosphokinase
MGKMKIVIIANGASSDTKTMQNIVTHADYIIAADGGIFHCLKNDIKPDCLIGDLDSWERETLDLSSRTKVIQISEQYSTDMEKAIEHAKTLNPEHIDIFCSFGKRTDHTLGNILILNNYPDLDIRMYDEYGSMYALNPGKKVFHNLKNTTISLFAFTHIDNLSLQGFEYPLDNSEVGPAFIGLSNKIIENQASITFDSGRLIVYILTDESSG